MRAGCYENLTYIYPYVKETQIEIKPPKNSKYRLEAEQEKTADKACPRCGRIINQSNFFVLTNELSPNDFSLQKAHFNAFNLKRKHLHPSNSSSTQIDIQAKVNYQLFHLYTKHLLSQKENISYAQLTQNVYSITANFKTDNLLNKDIKILLKLYDATYNLALNTNKVTCQKLYATSSYYPIHFFVIYKYKGPFSNFDVFELLNSENRKHHLNSMYFSVTSRYECLFQISIPTFDNKSLSITNILPLLNSSETPWTCKQIFEISNIDKIKEPSISDYIEMETIDFDKFNSSNRNTTFLKVGGHNNDWFKKKGSSNDYIVKKTNATEALAYLWFNSYDIPVNLIQYSDSLFKTFYSTLINFGKPCTNIKILQTLKKFIPKCYAIDFTLKDDKLVGFVELENLVNNVAGLCVMDIKMGTRLYGDDATELKRISMEKKALSTTSGKFGLRIIGGAHLNANTSKMTQIKRLDALVYKDLEQVKSSLNDFLDAAPFWCRDAVRQKFIEQLSELLNIFENQTLFALYGSSILLQFDSLSINPPQTVCVHLIDFAHITTYTNCKDLGYIKGLLTLLNTFKS